MTNYSDRMETTNDPSVKTYAPASGQFGALPNPSETNEAPITEPHLSASTDTSNYTPYLKEFDEEIKSSFDCIWVNAVNWGKNKLPGKDVPKVYKMASMGLIKLLSSSIESARREERQRVVEMVRKISKEYPIGKLYFEWLALEIESKSDLQSKLKEDK